MDKDILETIEDAKDVWKDGEKALKNKDESLEGEKKYAGNSNIDENKRSERMKLLKTIGIKLEQILLKNPEKHGFTKQEVEELISAYSSSPALQYGKDLSRM